VIEKFFSLFFLFFLLLVKMMVFRNRKTGDTVSVNDDNKKMIIRYRKDKDYQELVNL